MKANKNPAVWVRRVVKEVNGTITKSIALLKSFVNSYTEFVYRGKILYTLYGLYNPLWSLHSLQKIHANYGYDEKEGDIK
jgi:hypothetical protein